MIARRSALLVLAIVISCSCGATRRSGALPVAASSDAAVICRIQCGGGPYPEYSPGPTPPNARALPPPPAAITVDKSTVGPGESFQVRFHGLPLGAPLQGEVSSAPTSRCAGCAGTTDLAGWRVAVRTDSDPYVITYPGFQPNDGAGPYVLRYLIGLAGAQQTFDVGITYAP